MKKILICMCTALLLLGTTSCEDFLTEEPKQSQSNELTLAEYLDEATAGCYTRLQSYTWYGAEFVLYADITCGNAKHPITLPGSGRYLTSGPGSWNFSPTSTLAVWSYAYYTIACCNNVINNVAGNTTEAIEDLNNWKAEALFMRALSHFNLVTSYAQPYTADPSALGVPVVTVSDVNAKPARNTIAEVYAQIVADLKEAETLMEDDYYRTNGTDKYAAASKPAIQALLSRVYLYMGEWQNCADYATKVISSGKFNLADKATYATMWTNNIPEDGGEVIFEVFGSRKHGYWDESGWEGISYITDPTGSGDVAATNDLYNLYEDGDVRKTLFAFNEGEPFSTKYAGKAGSTVPKENNIIVLRYSEMFLNRAEAIYNGAVVSGTNANADLLAITSKRGASALSPSTENIFNERRRELAFEGHLYYDYKRLKKNMTRTEFYGTINKDVPFPSYLWAYPISKTELDANPNMVQNPEY